MFLACGVGAFWAGMFHVMTHACFKACLFLGAGAVMHAMSDDLDIRHMGGLRAKMPITFWTCVLAATSAIPGPPFAGFFSKDMILEARLARARQAALVRRPHGRADGVLHVPHRVPDLLRELRGTKEQAHHLHEAPTSMTLPLVVLGLPGRRRLARPAAVFGEHANVIEPFLASAVIVADRGPCGRRRGAPHAAEWLLMAVSVAVAASGLYLAYRWYAKEGGLPARIAASFPGAYALVADKYRIDELYDSLFVRPFNALARGLWKVVDVLVIDGILNAAAFLVELNRRLPALPPDRQRPQLRLRHASARPDRALVFVWGPSRWKPSCAITC